MVGSGSVLMVLSNGIIPLSSLAVSIVMLFLKDMSTRVVPNVRQKQQCVKPIVPRIRT